MIVVNNQSNADAYWPLRHAEWNGWTPTDLVFPFFLFIVGVSVVFSFRSRLARGESRQAILAHTAARSAILFVIGLALNGLVAVELGRWRIPGVLQRIAIVYCAAALITLFSTTRGQVAWLVALLAGYWILMRYVPVPGYGVPGSNVPLLHPDGNLAAHIDRMLMSGHLWEPTRDPEGILSTLPAAATALCGVLTGQWLRSSQTQQRKLAGLLAFGLLGVTAGRFWARWFPINKNLWTSSYVLFTAGCALICLGICYWVSDVRSHRGAWSKPFVIFGMNALVAYVISELIGGWFEWRGLSFFHSAADQPALESLLHSIVILVLCFVPVWWLYRKNMFIKV